MTALAHSLACTLEAEAGRTARALIACNRPPMIVLTAGDGAGKSTLLARLRPLMQGVDFLSIDPTFLYPLEAASHMDWALATHPRNVIWRCAPMVRGAFFVTTFSVLAEHYIRPALGRRPIVVDSYWYRYLAKERLQNPAGADMFHDFARRLPVPDLIVELSCDYGIAFRRKDSVSPLETREGDDAAAAFAGFQRDVAEIVRGLLPVQADCARLASTSVEATASSFLATIDSWLGGRAAQTRSTS